VSADNYEDLRSHVGHEPIVVSGYQPAWETGRDDYDNVAIECLECNEVLIDYEKPVQENR
jgi:hypothetical protein